MATAIEFSEFRRLKNIFQNWKLQCEMSMDIIVKVDKFWTNKERKRLKYQ